MLFLFAINNLLGCPLFTLFALLNGSLLLTCTKTGMMICFYQKIKHVIYRSIATSIPHQMKNDTLSTTITSTTFLYVSIQCMHVF